MRFFLAALLLLFAACQAQGANAADSLLSFKSNDPTLFLFPEQAPQLKTKKDYSNHYYESCVAGNNSPSLRESTALQCACTAAAMNSVMTLENMRDLYSRSSEANFQRARLMILGYIPCMKIPIQSYVLDDCLLNPEVRNSLRHERRVCHCMAEGMAEFAVKKGQYLVPGFVRAGFNPEQSVANPLAHVLNSKAFSIWSDYYMPKCIRNYEYAQ